MGCSRADHTRSRQTACRAARRETSPGLLILRTEGRIYFANAQRIADKMAPLVQQARPKVVLLDCGAVPDIEFTALKMMIDAEERLRGMGISLWLARLNPAALEVVQRSPLGARLGRERMFFNVNRAVEAYLAREAASREAPES